MKLLLLTAFFGIATVSSAQTWLWSETPGGTASSDFLAMCTDPAGNCYATGYFNGTITFGSLAPMTAAGNSSVFVVKFDNNGNALWDAQSNGNSFDQGSAIAVDASGSVYITGYFESTTLTFGSLNLVNAGTMNIFVAKYNSAGTLQWAERFGDNSTNWQMGNAIVVDPKGNTYVTGCFHGNLIVPPLTSPAATGRSENYDMFLMKLNTNGGGVWARRTAWSNGKPGTTYTNGTAIALNYNGILCAGGEFVGDTCFYETDTLNDNALSGGASDAFLAEYDTSGKFINKAAHISSSGYDEVTGISADKSGNFYATGIYGEILYFPNFTISWSGTNGSYNIWLLKMKANGDLAWGNRIGNSTYGQTPLGLLVDTNSLKSDFYTWGYFQGECDFDAIVLPDSAGAYGMYLAKYDSAGAAQQVLVSQRDSKASRSVVGAGVDKSDNLYVTGTFSDTLIFGSLPYLSTPNPSTASEFLAKYGTLPTSIGAVQMNNGNISFYPNPSKGIFNFQITKGNQQMANSQIEVYNMVGKKVYSNNQLITTNRQVQIDLSDQPSGIYLYRLMSGNGECIKSGKLTIVE